MNWKNLAAKVADWAPAIGGVLAGPAGATAGSLLASTLGTADNADAVSAAISADPKAAAKIKQAELDHKLAMQKLLVSARATELTQQSADLAEVNQTMRTELSTAGLWKTGWRSAVGWVMAFSFLIMTAALCYAVIADPTQLADAVSGLMSMVFTMGAVLGISIHKTSQEKQAALTGLPQAGLVSLLKK